LIAGAGIGGLTAALGLGRAGFAAAIFERAPVLEEFGAGLQLAPNATRVLARLDALETVRRFALAPQAIRILRGRDDALISTLPLHDAEARWGAPYLVVHRADLQRALIERIAGEPGVALTLGAEVGGFAADEAGVTLGVKRGLVSVKERGEALIGADGLRSIVRERMGFGARDAAAFSGRVAFRATMEAARAPERLLKPEVTLRLGSRAHLVHYPLRDGAMVNIVAVIESDARREASDHPWDGVADHTRLKRAFADWSVEAQALIAEGQWRAWPIADRPPIPSFALERAALLGDAAHPMAPFLAQGAAQAIEDAGALADCLAATASAPEGLRAYSQRRAPRAERVQRAAKAQADIYHLAGPLALARDIAMRALGPERLLRRYDWLYGA